MPAHARHPEFEERAKLLGAKIRHRFDELGLTEMQLIELTGLSRSTVQRLLNGRGGPRNAETGEYPPPNPRSDVVWLLESALDLEPGYLMDTTRGVESMGGRGHV